MKRRLVRYRKIKAKAKAQDPRAYANFLITGHGRSGTQFLAQVMNRSKVWNVAHEPAKRSVIKRWRAVSARFAKDHYGEVNSLLRIVAPDAVVAKKAVILRHPKEITLSFYNKRVKQKRNPRADLDQFIMGFWHVDNCIKRGLPVIRFDRMVSEPDYLSGILEAFGITDVPVDEDTCTTRCNHLSDKDRIARSVEDCGYDIPEAYKRGIQWFEEAYFDGNARTVHHLL